MMSGREEITYTRADIKSCSPDWTEADFGCYVDWLDEVVRAEAVDRQRVLNRIGERNWPGMLGVAIHLENADMVRELTSVGRVALTGEWADAIWTKAANMGKPDMLYSATV